MLLSGAFLLTGADNRSRTYDLLITNELLYQLSYVGLNSVLIIAFFNSRGNRKIHAASSRKAPVKDTRFKRTYTINRWAKEKETQPPVQPIAAVIASINSMPEPA